MLMRGASLIGKAAAGRPISSPAPSPPPAGLPLWRQGQAVNEWRELSGTSLSTQPVMAAPRGSNAPQGKVDGWNGLGIDLRTLDVYSPGNGGHDDYWGNEVERLRLSEDAPAWTQVRAPTASADVSFDADYYTDGRPASQHTYHGVIVVESLDRVLRFPGGSRSRSGNPSARITAYNIGAGDWDNSASVWPSLAPPVGGIGAAEAAYAKDASENVYAWFTNGALARWNASVPGTWTTLLSGASIPARVYETAAAVDTSRNVVFFLGGGNGGTDICHRYNIGSNTLQAITLTGADIKSSNGSALVYFAETDRYYALIQASGGSSVYEITPGSGTSWPCSLLSTTGGSSLPATDGSLGERKPFTKMLAVPAYGGLFWLPRWTANGWFLRVV